MAVALVCAITLAVVCGMVSPALLESANAASDPVGSEAAQTPSNGQVTLDARGDGFKVTAEAPAEAQVPQGVALKAKQVLSKDAKDSDATANANDDNGSPLADYDQLHEAALAKAKAKEQDSSLESFDTESYYDISLKQGQSDVDPKAEVKVTLSYDQPADVKDADEVRVICLAEKDGKLEATLLDKDKIEADIQDGKLSKLTFKADSLSAFAVVTLPQADEQGADANDADNSDDTASDELTQQTITADSSDGASVEISGQLPQGAEASISPVQMSDDEINSYLGDSASGAIDSKAVYDIAIKVNGEEWEPDQSVSVKVKNPAVKASDDANVMVAHLEGNQAKTVDADAEAADEVSFDADSFSPYVFYTYTVDFYHDDAEWHMAGGSTVTLSQLFEGLGIDTPVDQVTNVEFSDSSLLQVAKGDDGIWTLKSLKPFTSDETLIVTLADGTTIEITTKDDQVSQGPRYSRYTFSSNLTPFAGSISEKGKYEIFGGGNGLAAVDEEAPQNSNWYAGRWGRWSWYNATRKDDHYRWEKLKGKSVGKDPQGGSITPVSGEFISASSGDIKFDGSVGDGGGRAFFSFGYNTGQHGKNDILKITIYGPKYADKQASKNIELQTEDQISKAAANNYTLPTPTSDTDKAVIYIDRNERDNVSQDSNEGRQDSQYVGSTFEGWKYLTFDATSFVKNAGNGGNGKYTVVVEWTVGPDDSDQNKSAFNGDMGWSIYGYANNPALNHDNAIAVMAAEKHIDKDTPQQVNLSEPFMPNGSYNGKVWFNCQGGETAKRPGDTSTTVTDDTDSLELQLSENGSSTYKKLGGSPLNRNESSNCITVYSPPIENDGTQKPTDAGWLADDIAKPNKNQTMVNDADKIDNSYSFGMGLFKGSDIKSPIVGIRKTMQGGWDTFGSLMLETPIDPETVSTTLTKQLKLDGLTMLPSEGSNEIFKFRVKPLTDGAPVPNGGKDSADSKIYTGKFETAANPSDISTGKLTIAVGPFNFTSVTDTTAYKYEITEVAGSDDRWTYSNEIWYLTWHVTESTDHQVSATAFWSKDINATYSDDLASNSTPAVFTNTYTGGSFSFTKMGTTATGSSKPVSNARFALYEDKDCKNPLKDLNDANSEATSDSQGNVTFTALPVTKEGSTYYMKEVSAPAGYRVDGKTYSVAIKYGGTTATIQDIDNNNRPVTSITDPLLKIDLKKVDSNSKAQVNGSEFSLETEKQNQSKKTYEPVKFNKTTDSDDNVKYSVNSDGSESTLSVENGNVEIDGLPAGTYRLTETKAPDGYVLNTSKLRFKVSEIGDVTLLGQDDKDVQVGVKHTATVGNATLTVPSNQSDAYTLSISNSAGIALPDAGGSGTALFVLIGGVCVAVAAALLVRARKNRA